MWCGTIARAIHELPSEKWIWHMGFLCHAFVTRQAPNQWNEEENKILDTLAMYQAKEKLALLELAIWKHQCLSSFAVMTCARIVSMKDIEDYGALDPRFLRRLRFATMCASGVEPR
jgi:hypothetical protein